MMMRGMKPKLHAYTYVLVSTLSTLEKRTALYSNCHLVHDGVMHVMFFFGGRRVYIFFPRLTPHYRIITKRG